jgi:RND family efflux transporter MFP subunit
MRVVKALLVLALVIAGTAGGAIVLRRPASAAPPAPPQVAVVTERDFSPQVLATGFIRLLPGARIAVGARVSGVVVSLPVTQGSRVEPNDVIARLDDREARSRLAQAEATVVELDALLRQREDDLVRAEGLRQAGGSTEQEILNARTALAAARARLEGARASRELALLQLDYTVIRAPIGGVVASVSTQEGETVAASFAAPTFVTLLDPSRIECVALVDETDIGRVRVKDSAEFTVDAWPGRVFRGLVTGIAPDATINGGVVDYEVRIRIAGPVLDLKPQMTASVSIGGTSRRALLVPTTAVRQSAVGTYVWRVRQGAPERVPVVLGARQPDVTEVKSGLSPRDTVLTGGFPDTR